MILFTPKLIVFAGVAVGAVVMAAFTEREDRPVAVICAGLLLASWLMHLSSWTPWSLEGLFVAEPQMSDALSAWAALNCIVGLFVLLLACREWGFLDCSRETRWGQLLYVLLLCGCANDALRWAGWEHRSIFNGIADCLFLTEELIFFALGGRGAWLVFSDYVARCYRVAAPQVVVQKSMLR